MFRAIVRDLTLIAVGVNISLFAFGAFMGDRNLIWLSGLASFVCIFALTIRPDAGGSDDSKS